MSTDAHLYDIRRKVTQRITVDLCDRCDQVREQCACPDTRFTPVLFERVFNGPWRYFLPDRSRQQ